MFSMITEASYQSRYDPYPSPIQRATVPQHYRSMSHQHLAQWSCPDQMDPYVRDPYVSVSLETSMSATPFDTICVAVSHASRSCSSSTYVSKWFS